MKTFFIIFAILFYASGLSAKNRIEIYRYTDPVRGGEISLDVEKMQIVIDRHAILDAKECKYKYKYKCMIAPGGNFIFPTSAIRKNMNYKYSKSQFKVTKEVRYKILGKIYPAFLIQSQENGCNYWYLFSNEFGLLAFGKLINGGASVFILQNKCGFASPYDCEN